MYNLSVLGRTEERRKEGGVKYIGLRNGQKKEGRKECVHTKVISDNNNNKSHPHSPIYLLRNVTTVIISCLQDRHGGLVAKASAS